MPGEVIKLGGLLGNHQATTVYHPEGVSPTLTAGMDHGNTMPYIIEEQDGADNSNIAQPSK